MILKSIQKTFLGLFIKILQAGGRKTNKKIRYKYN